jgi:hypothetical protein
MSIRGSAYFKARSPSAVEPVPLVTREEWRPVGESGVYEVSNLGRIRSACDHQVKEPSNTDAGVLVVNLYESGRCNVLAVHSVVAEAFLGARPKGFMVQPTDGDRTHCAASNLAYVPLGMRIPRKESDRGRPLAGKLTREQAAEIRSRAKAGEAVKNLAGSFGVSSSLVSNIKHGKKWKDA